MPFQQIDCSLNELVLFPYSDHTAQEWVDYFFDPRVPNEERDEIEESRDPDTDFEHIKAAVIYLLKKLDKGMLIGGPVRGIDWQLPDRVENNERVNRKKKFKGFRTR